MQAGGLRFDTGNYVLAGATPGEALTLGGAAPTITVAKPDSYTKISATLARSNGFTLAGPGTLTLTGANTYTGGTTISSGTLNVWHDFNLGMAASPVTLVGGTLQLGSAFIDRTVNVASGSTLHISSNFGADIQTLAGAAAFTKAGGGTLRLRGRTRVIPGTSSMTEEGCLS